MRFGVVAAGVTLGLGFLLAELGLAASAWGFLVILPLTFSCYSLLSGLFGTCAVAGMRGVRQADHGLEPVIDASLMRGLRRRGLALLAFSAALAGVSAGIFVGSV